MAKHRGLNLPLVVTMVSWAFNFVALKLLYAYPSVSPQAVALSRIGGMYAILIAIRLAQGKAIWPNKGDAFKVSMLGFISLGVYMAIFLEGMELTSAPEAAIMLATAPLITYFMAIGLKQEAFRWSALAGAFVAFTGIGIVYWHGLRNAHGHLFGNTVLLLDAFLWSYSVVLTKSLSAKYDPLALLTMGMPGALLVIVPYALKDCLALNWLGLGGVPWLLLFYLAAVSGVLAYICFYIGIRAIGAGPAMLYQYFVPPMTLLFAWWFLSATPEWPQVVGMATVVGGVAIAMRGRSLTAGKAGCDGNAECS